MAAVAVPVAPAAAKPPAADRAPSAVAHGQTAVAQAGRHPHALPGGRAKSVRAVLLALVSARPKRTVSRGPMVAAIAPSGPSARVPAAQARGPVHGLMTVANGPKDRPAQQAAAEVHDPRHGLMTAANDPKDLRAQQAAAAVHDPAPDWTHDLMIAAKDLRVPVPVVGPRGQLPVPTIVPKDRPDPHALGHALKVAVQVQAVPHVPAVPMAIATSHVPSAISPTPSDPNPVPSATSAAVPIVAANVGAASRTKAPAMALSV